MVIVSKMCRTPPKNWGHKIVAAKAVKKLLQPLKKAVSACRKLGGLYLMRPTKTRQITKTPRGAKCEAVGKAEVAAVGAAAAKAGRPLTKKQKESYSKPAQKKACAEAAQKGKVCRSCAEATKKKAEKAAKANAEKEKKAKKKAAEKAKKASEKAAKLGGKNGTVSTGALRVAIPKNFRADIRLSQGKKGKRGTWQAMSQVVLPGGKPWVDLPNAQYDFLDATLAGTVQSPNFK